MKRFWNSLLCTLGFHDYVPIVLYNELSITTLECTRCKDWPNWR